jgi:hypothetical protein
MVSEVAVANARLCEFSTRVTPNKQRVVTSVAANNNERRRIEIPLATAKM